MMSGYVVAELKSEHPYTTPVHHEGTKATKSIDSLDNELRPIFIPWGD
jgi:hypothetical protein